MFSKEQIKELQHKLGLLGVKDTAFPVATSLDGNETLTIVQDAINKKTYLKDIVNYVSIFNTDLVTKNSLKTVNGQSLLGKGDIDLSNLDTTIPYVVVKIEAGAGSVIAGNIIDVRDAKSNNKPCLAYVYNLDEAYGMIGSFHLCSIQSINPTTAITNLIYHTELGTTHKTVLLSVSGNGRVTISTDEHNYTTSDELNNAIHTRQVKLYSGMNIKTINGKSILGSGNLTIEEGSAGTSGGTTIVDIIGTNYDKLLEIGLDECIITTYNGHSYYSYVRREGTNKISVYGINTQHIDFTNYNINYIKAIYTKDSNAPEVSIGVHNIGKEVLTIKYLDYNYYNDLLEYEGLVSIQYEDKIYSCITVKDTGKITVQGSYLEKQDSQSLLRTIEIQYTPSTIIGPTNNIAVIKKEEDHDIYCVDPSVFSYNTDFAPLKKAIESSKAIFIQSDNTVLYPAVPQNVSDDTITLISTINVNTEDGITVSCGVFTFYSYSKAASSKYFQYTLKSSGNGTKFLADDGEYKEAAMNTLASHSNDGLMSKEDKIKLDTYNATLTTVKITQAEYSTLESAGTLDSNTIYYIVG